MAKIDGTREGVLSITNQTDKEFNFSLVATYAASGTSAPNTGMKEGKAKILDSTAIYEEEGEKLQFIFEDKKIKLKANDEFVKNNAGQGVIFDGEYEKK